MDAPMDEDVPVQEEFLACRGAETQVLKFGPWTDLLRPGSQGSPKLLVLVVAGNPGIPAFYLSFAKALYLTLDKHHPVWVVSHAGHVMAPRGVEVTEESPEDPGPGTTDDVFGLEGQVEHKLAFLRRYVPGSLKLVLIGHSIGAYILLEMMKRAPQLPVLRAFLLFPTIERMAKSPNGRVVTPLLCWLRYALYVPLFIGLSLVPVRFKAMLASMFLQNVDMENSVLARLMNSLNMSCVANAMYLGSQEMRTVLERDNPTIQKHLKKGILLRGNLLPGVLLGSLLPGVLLGIILPGVLLGSLLPGVLLGILLQGILLGSLLQGSLLLGSLLPGILLPGILLPGSLLPGVLLRGSLLPGVLLQGSLLRGSLLPGVLQGSLLPGVSPRAASSQASSSAALLRGPPP